MPRRGKAPGLKRGRHNLPYWIASQITRETYGFPDRCIPLPAGADEETLTRLCHEHTARLDLWIEQHRPAPGAVPARPRFQYDGTVQSLSRLYQTHPESPFHDVKSNTRRTYTDSLKIIEATVGQRVIRKLTILDVRRWYREWRQPRAEGGRERVDRAHDAVAMFRTVLRFGAALRHKECGELDRELAMVRFERGGAREQEMTYQQASAFVRKAIELGHSGVIPYERGLYMAIGVAAQFELLLRQKDVIGEWNEKPGARVAHRFGDEVWCGFFTWEAIPGWRWRMKTSKSKYRAAAEFDLTSYSLLFPLLESVPPDQRQGAIIKGEGGLPVRERSYRKWFRPIARAAGIPDEVWSMDSRAGGATEAEEAGADLDAIQSALTHTKRDTTLRYIRRRTTKIALVAEARQKNREGGDGGA